jgi:hypothetical protein
MVRPDANRKRRQILACLTRHETMGRDSLNGAKPSQTYPGFFRKISPNLLWYYKADTSYNIGPGPEEIKPFARLDQGARYPVISAMSGYSQGHRADVLNYLQAWSRRKLRACMTFFQVHHLRLSRSTNYECALTVRLSTTNSVIIL